MRASRRLAAILSLLLVGAAPARRGGLPTAPVEDRGDRIVEVRPVLLSVPEATSGPPDMSCGMALGIAAEDRSLTDPRVRGETAPAQDIYDRSEAAAGKGSFEGAAWTPAERVANPVITQAAVTTGAVQGLDMEQVPPRALEGTPEVLWHVGDILRAAEARERVRISVFGASHTEADFFTGHLRRLLQGRYGDIGHGFLWPADPVARYRATDVNLCYSPGWRGDFVGRTDGRRDGLYGLGASVSSGDPAAFGWLETTHTNPLGRRVGRYHVFTVGEPGGGTLLVTVDEVPPRAISTDTAVTRLLHHRVEVPDGPHRLMVQPLGDGEVRILGVSVERPGSGVIVDAIGIRGRQARSWLRWDRTLFQQSMQALRPDMVVLAYGTNEAADSAYAMERYADDLRAVLRRMREATPDAACVLAGPTDRVNRVGEGRYAIWGRTAEVARIQRQVAPEFGCAFWDWQAAMGGPGSILAWRMQEPALASADYIHLTQRGYELSAERFLDAMGDAAARTAVGR
ncbi:MAG: SGNH/GDSL hydrolase family protein [Myxococcota bacterium]|nr:SGNH/GDSL hydrolase family protein [Myxococcota bacterium]